MSTPPLLTELLHRIKSEGAMPVDAYMRECLQHPHHGYYRVKETILGRAGDFVTAPAVSPMFGEMIGMWCADMFERLNRPDSFMLLEIGSGDGTCLRDVLRAVSGVEGFKLAAHVRTIDINHHLSGCLRDHCATQLSECASFKQHHTFDAVRIEAETQGLPMILYANEWLDTLPVKQFVKSSVGWHERCVDADDNHALRFVFRAPTIALPEPLTHPLYTDAIRDTSFEQPILEYPEAALNELAGISDMLATRSGACLFIDYGYVRPPLTSTVQTLRKHKHTDIFDRPGQDDMTALVDFSLLQTVMSAVPGGNAFETSTQRDFLRHYGIQLRAALLSKGKSESEQADMKAALSRLIDPEEMGILFKIGGCLVPKPA